MTTATLVGVGIYHDPATGNIFKVQWNEARTSRYAKVLVTETVEDYPPGPGPAWISTYRRFEYAPGAINRISPEWKMSLERMQNWGRSYGVCLECMATLTDPESIKRGMGPVCYEHVQEQGR